MDGDEKVYWKEELIEISKNKRSQYGWGRFPHLYSRINMQIPINVNYFEQVIAIW